MYEYKVYQPQRGEAEENIETELNRLADEGWRLVPMDYQFVLEREADKELEEFTAKEKYRVVTKAEYDKLGVEKYNGVRLVKEIKRTAAGVKIKDFKNNLITENG